MQVQSSIEVGKVLQQREEEVWRGVGEAGMRQMGGGGVTPTGRR